ncbi:hypothetical protein ECC02_002230 [Trypanosoma cruzi]|uniref:Uncharacterized protein n=1 Tax=Trypanosoma cruzi TaxID=5693 RepID=A0A7J6YCW8_TRYCR|nr:hypothetical protein ECC02_002230 [Trypanosoma cruzi]
MEFLVKALQLQHSRCEVYQLWDAKFHLALSGALSAVDLQTILTNTIVAAFQQVSSSLRQLQDIIRVEEKEAAENGDLRQFLVAWIDRVQRLEQEHYHTSVRLSQQIAEHGKAVSLTQRDTRETATSPEDDLHGIHAKAAPTERPDLCASLHDAELCSLRRLVPLTSQKAFTFVSCCDATALYSDDDDDVGKEENMETNESGEKARNDATDDEDNERVSFEFKSGVMVPYAPKKVRRCCLAFNKTVLPLWKAKRSLMQQLQDWTEELQAEVASAAAVK